MIALDSAHRYFAAWNAHDAAAIVATFAPDGTYEDPATPGPLRGDAIGTHAAALWRSFPDLRFEIVSEQEAGGVVASQWMMRGTNHGAMNGLPPSGRQVALPGADFITVGPQGITSVRGHFDSGAIPRQVGLNVVVQPAAIGPLSLGVSSRVPGQSPARPAALSVTSLRVRSAVEADAVRTRSRQIAVEMTKMEGFMGLVTATVGDRMMTFSAWDSTDAPRRMSKDGTHRSAMPEFFRTLSTGGWTSVWVPERINPHWQRCASCGQMEDGEAKVSCRCGAPLPPLPPYL